MDIITITILILLGIIIGISLSILVLLFIKKIESYVQQAVGQVEYKLSEKGAIVGLSDEESSFSETLNKDKDYKIE